MDYGDINGLGTLAPASDLSITSQAQGDILYYNGTNWVRLAAGTAGQRLETQGAGSNPTWENEQSNLTGDVTSVGLVTTVVGGNADTVTTNANLTGPITSVGNATTITNDSVGVNHLADGTDGEIITWDATGEATTVAVGTAGDVLTSAGAGAPPTFSAPASAGGLSLVYDNETTDTDNSGTYTGILPFRHYRCYWYIKFGGTTQSKAVVSLSATGLSHSNTRNQYQTWGGSGGVDTTANLLTPPSPGYGVNAGAWGWFDLDTNGPLSSQATSNYAVSLTGKVQINTTAAADTWIMWTDTAPFFTTANLSIQGQKAQAPNTKRMGLKVYLYTDTI